MLAVGVLVWVGWVAGSARPSFVRGGPHRSERLQPAAATSRPGATLGAAAALRATPTSRRSGTARATLTSRATTPRATGTPRATASIVGGSPASIARFPFQVALYDPQAGSPSAGFFCGGVIIDATHVATAAHCVVEGPGRRSRAVGEVAVLAGSSTLAPLAPGSATDPVQSSSFDSRYNPISSDYDVALLTLAHPLWASATPPSVNGANAIAPIPLDGSIANEIANPNATPASIVTASGWGDVNPVPSRDPSYPISLRSVRMPLVSESVCEEEYGAIEQNITSRMLCAGGGRTRVDTCYGDSGGPLVADADTPARPPADYVLIGLVDFGNGCAQAGYAGVYTRISNPEVMRFLTSGAGHVVQARSARAKRRRHRRRHRHRHRTAASHHRAHVGRR